MRNHTAQHAPPFALEAKMARHLHSAASTLNNRASKAAQAALGYAKPFGFVAHMLGEVFYTLTAPFAAVLTLVIASLSRVWQIAAAPLARAIDTLANAVAWADKQLGKIFKQQQAHAPDMHQKEPKLRHPKELYILFFTEFWERFGFYLMVNILAMYLQEKYHLSDGQASHIVGTFSAFVYFAPFIGGMVADKYLGYRRSVITGAILLAFGYFVFAYMANLPGKNYYFGMIFLVIGNALFKPNISTMVGKLYPPGDKRRDSAFSLFYLGINLGALPSGSVGAFLHEHYSWGAAFSAAGFGMIVPVITQLVFYRRLNIAENKSSIGAIFNMNLPKEYDDTKPADRKWEKLCLTALAIVFIAAIPFWGAFEQNKTSLTFWAKNVTDRVLRIGSFSHEISAESFQGFNALFVITLTPILIFVMKALNKRGWEPSTPAKMIIGMLVSSLAFALLAIAWVFGGGADGKKVSMFWLIGCYFFLTIGELLLSPMALSLVAKLAPRRMTAMLMGCWFAATALGNYTAGAVGTLWDIWPHSKFFLMTSAALLLTAAGLATQYKRLIAVMPKPAAPGTEAPVAVVAPLEICDVPATAPSTV